MPDPYFARHIALYYTRKSDKIEKFPLLPLRSVPKFGDHGSMNLLLIIILFINTTIIMILNFIGERLYHTFLVSTLLNGKIKTIYSVVQQAITDCIGHLHENKGTSRSCRRILFILRRRTSLSEALELILSKFLLLK